MDEMWFVDVMDKFGGIVLEIGLCIIVLFGLIFY